MVGLLFFFFPYVFFISCSVSLAYSSYLLGLLGASFGICPSLGLCRQLEDFGGKENSIFFISWLWKRLT